MSVIHDLYHDNLCLADRIVNKKSEYHMVQLKLTDETDNFIKSLNDEQKKQFDVINDLSAKSSCLLEFDSFSVGLKFGIRFMHEVFQDDVPECTTFPLR